MTEKFIIVADDDEDDKLLLHSAFEDIGCDSKIVFVNNGVELLLFLEKNYDSQDPNQKPCIILLDLNMGIKNGKEVLKDLKQDENFKEIPVLMYSTSQAEADKKDCYALGADTYIVKPSHYNVLLKVVEDIRFSWLLCDKKAIVSSN
jgi:CheY-like chemotaxis protein